MKKSNKSEIQRQIIHAWLLTGSLTTIQARQLLDILHPSARVQELKAEGLNIVTDRVWDDSGKGLHKVGRYTLLTSV